MKTHITKSLIAALALALVTNLHAQTPAAPAPPATPVARDPFAAGKAAEGGNTYTSPTAVAVEGGTLRFSGDMGKNGGVITGTMNGAGAGTLTLNGTENRGQGTLVLTGPLTLAGKSDNTEAVNISLAYEAFSLPIAKAGELQRKGISDTEIYKELVATGKLERMLVLRTKSGQRAVLENATEYRYATEFDQAHAADAAEQPEAANDEAKKDEPAVPSKAAKVQRLAIPVTPTAFEMKNVGDSLEVEPTLSPDGKILDLNVSITHTAVVGRDKWGHGLGEVEQPQFETQKANTNVSLVIGPPSLIGTLNPVFGNGVTPRAEQNIWFCFITATGVRISSEPVKKSAH
jgi:hypothetical protein